ncbi:hypothetical protein VTJ83DRAFT_2885 [Remersonia thermophila]|uniref:NAD(P)-binding protein n=1 Tax=Remersonia thermophila TaxID=72144 RepID=A0ABR4DDF2_9PEZI
MSSNLDASTLFRVDGMVAVITGGSSGIGLTMARTLAANGATRVYLLSRRLNVLDEAVALHPTIFRAIQCDVTSHTSLRDAVEIVTAESGFINLLVANSGIGGFHFGWNPDYPVETVRQWFFPKDDAEQGQRAMEMMNETLKVNTTGAFFTMVAFLELLEKGNKRAVEMGAPEVDGEKVFGAPVEPGSAVPAVQSQIIVMSSIAAFSRSSVSDPAYAASKAGVLHIAKQALFPSDLANRMIGDRDPSKEEYDDPRFQPSRRFGGGEEMAGTILYLASRSGAYCNGSVMVVDGGRLGVMPSSY